MTITEKILARASSNSEVSPGDVVFANVDKAMMHDVSGPGAKVVLDEVAKEKGPLKVWDPSRVWMAEDHFVPCSDTQAAGNMQIMEKMAKDFGITKYYRFGQGQHGICHTLATEEGLVLPGEVFAGGDSHTNTAGALGVFAVGLGHTDLAYVLLNGKIWFRVPETIRFKIDGDMPAYSMAKDLILMIIGEIGVDGATYKTMQFEGSTVIQMNIDERLTLTNMSTEAGAKNGIIEPDEKTFKHVEERSQEKYSPIHGDPGCRYADTFSFDGAKLEPMVARPYSPQNVCPVREVSNKEIDRAYIGSCTGAKITDLREAAKVLKGNKVVVRTEVLPAAQSIYKRALDEGLIKIFLDSGALVGPSTCGACCGAHMGVLGKNEVCVSTTNRNFPGRMGDRESQTFLASPKTVAASSITGRITDVRDLSG
ncbi:MAG: aconitase/3-isopropylmalate dehydratase large subunit family protein [Nitrososphaerales archaeon]